MKSVCAALLACAISSGCSIGKGEGRVHSDMLFIGDCWQRPYDLEPTFFAANPFEDDLSIRIQSGEESIHESDGISLLVHDLTEVRTTQLNQRLPLALPVGVTPIGFPPPETPRTAMANLTLYLNDTCPRENAALSAISGWVQFEQLFSGDPNENDSNDRWTVGSFEAVMVDTRDAIARPNPGLNQEPYQFPEDRQSLVTGDFRFVFHRGTPAQPFP